MNSQQSHLDRAAERRTDLDFLEAKLSDPNTRLLPVWRGQPLARADELSLVRVEQAQELVDASSEIVWLGFFEGVACFALDISPLESPAVHAALSGSEPAELRALVTRLPASRAELALYARAMLTWHQRHQYCGVCGHATRPRQGGHLRVCARAECAAQHFPRTDPCVLVLVRDGEHCLLGRSAGWPPGMYSALAGFVEPGESLEQAAAREVLEEVGVEIGDVQYVGSQAWPFPASLMMGFVANARSREIRVDGVELEAARWVSRSELSAPTRADFFVPRADVSLSGRLIADFVNGAP
jgi:NAD+ diphosphatase